MKSKLKGVLGIVFALVLVASMMLFALPTAADPFTDPAPTMPNAWVYSYPTEGIQGGYFFDSTIGQVGPIAKGIDGDLYANVVDATTDPVAEVRTCTISGSPRVGDVVTVTVDGNAVNYTVVEADIGATDAASLANIAAKVAAAINADATVSAIVIATSAGSLTSAAIILTATMPGTYGDFTSSCSTTQMPASTLTGGPGGDSTTAATDGSPQNENFTPTVIAAGGVWGIRITIPPTGTDYDFIYTASGAPTADEIVNAFVSLINTHPIVSMYVVASGVGGPPPTSLDITALVNSSTDIFTAVENSLDPGAPLFAGGDPVHTAGVDPTQQISTTLFGGSPKVGDVITVTIDFTTAALDPYDTVVTYTVVEADIGADDTTSRANIIAKLVAAIMASPAWSYVTPDGLTLDTLTVTADNPGTYYAFTYGTTVTNKSASTLACACAQTVVPADSAAGNVRFFKSEPSSEAGHSWFQSTDPLAYDGPAVAGGAIVDMVCSEINEDVIYVTDGNYVYKSVDGGMNFMKVAQADLEANLMGACGMTITHKPITCIDVGYNANNEPFVFIGTKYVGHHYPVGHAEFPGDAIVGSVYYIADEAFPAEWHDLQLKCYGCCDPDNTFITVTFEVTGTTAALTTTYTGVLANTPIVPGTLFIYNASFDEVFTDTGFGTFTGSAGGSGTIDYVTGAWSVTFNAQPTQPEPIFADYVYPNNVIRGCFDVYSVGVDPNFAVTSKTYAAITTDDVNCDAAGATPATQIVSTTGTICMWSLVDELFWDCNVANPFEIRHASRFAFPDDFADSHTMFIGVAGTYPNGPGGDVYSATDSAPPAQDALDLNVRGYLSGCTGLYHANICSLDIMGSTGSAQLIAGALDTYQDQSGTDVFYSTDGGWTWSRSAKDPTGEDTTYVLWYEHSPLTAFAGTRGCNCAFSMACGDEIGKYWNQIALIAMDIDQVWDLSHAPGYVFDDTTMYVLTHDNDTCEQVGGPQPSESLLRWDGTYWYRVFSTMSPEYAIDITKPDGQMDWVEVSPDFNTTDCLYLANTYFDIFRSTDRGCNWTVLPFPCEPKDEITAWIVVDEETVLASGGDTAAGYAGTLYRTTRHGTRPWEEFFIYNSTGSVKACCGVDFDLSLPRAATSDVLLGDECGQVYLSQDLGETWTEIEDVLGGGVPGDKDFAGPADQTYVVFDPGYAVAGDPGENTFYAAGGTFIGRCTYNADVVPPFKQDWLYLSAAAGDCVPCDLQLASGIDAAGDTVLYVADAGDPSSTSPSVSIDGTIEVNCEIYEAEPNGGGCVGCSRDIDLSPGVAVTPISGSFINGELVDIVSYNLVCTLQCGDEPTLGQEEYCLCRITGEIGLKGFESEAYGMISVNDVQLMPDCDYCECTAITNESLGTGDGAKVTFTGTLLNFPVCVSSLTITDGFETFADNGFGTLTGDQGGTGTIDYATGVYSVTFDSAPTSGVPVLATYSYDTSAPAYCSGTANATVVDSFLQATAAAGTSPKATGVWRTVDALALIDEISHLNFVEWEFLGSEYLTSLRHPVAHSGFYIYPDDLWLTQGSNVLWVLDQVAGVPTDDIWMWDDPLAAPVIPISPADGALLPTTSTVTLEWEALDAATQYEVALYKDCPECLTPTKMLAVTVTDPDPMATCLLVEGLLPGTKYFWKVRVACGSPKVSKWSELRSFETALLPTGMCSPACGEEDISLTPNFSWPAVVGATSYEIDVASDEAFTNIIASGTPTINAWDGVPELEYSTTYYWRVRAVKDGVYSAWTYCLFSTMAEPEEPVSPVIPVTIVEEEITPTWIWVIIGIGGALTIAVVILIVTTRRVP